MKVKCCVCDKVRRDGVWCPAEPGEASDPNVSHGYCPECAEIAFREIRALRYRGPGETKLAANN